MRWKSGGSGGSVGSGGSDGVSIGGGFAYIGRRLSNASPSGDVRSFDDPLLAFAEDDKDDRFVANAGNWTNSSSSLWSSSSVASAPTAAAQAYSEDVQTKLIGVFFILQMIICLVGTLGNLFSLIIMLKASLRHSSMIGKERVEEEEMEE